MWEGNSHVSRVCMRHDPTEFRSSGVLSFSLIVIEARLGKVLNFIAVKWREDLPGQIDSALSYYDSIVTRRLTDIY